MAQVEALTGIKGHTIRMWERRYSFLEPKRTSTNIRYYTDGEIRKLLNISILNKNGIKVSKIDKMTDEEINEAILDMFKKTGAEPTEEINKLSVCMLEMNEVEFEKLFQKQLHRYGILKTMINVIYPFLNHVGVLWATDNAMPVQEHFVSNLIRQKIIVGIDSLPLATGNARSIVMFLTEDEDHEISLLLAWFIARDLGWQVYYLGQKVPIDNLIEVVNMKQPDLILTMLTTPMTKRYKGHITQIVEQINIPLLMSGTSINLDHFNQDAGKIVKLNSPGALVDFLQEH